MTSLLTLDNLRNLEAQQRWTDLLDSAKRFVLQRPPEVAWGYYYQGIAYHELRQYNYAADAFDQAVKIDANNSSFFNARGLLFRDQKMYERAIEQFELAAERPPELLNPIINKAQTLTLMNRHEDALAIYNVVLSRYPDYIPAMIFKAECLKELGRPAEALAIYDQAITMDPTAADLVFNKGNIYANQNNLDRALECYNKSIQLDPEFPDAYYHLGLVNQRLGRRQEALNNYQRAMQQNSAAPLAYVAAAELYSQSGDYRQALSLMDDAIQKYPNSPFGYYNAGILKLSQGNYKASAPDFENAIKTLDEPDTAKKQLLRIAAENTTELDRVNNYFGSGGAGSQRVAVNYASLAEGMIVKKENQTEIGNNLREIKNRIYDLQANAENRRRLDEELVALQQNNPGLFEYVTTLLRMERNYLYNTNFNLPRASYAPTSINFLRNARERPALDYYSSGDQAADLIIKGSKSKLSSNELLDRTAYALKANANGFDPEETHFQITKSVLNRIHSSDEKNREIVMYDTNDNAKRWTSNILDQFPKLRPEVNSAASAVALKDFILMNNHLASNAQVADSARNTYTYNFNQAYGSNSYEGSGDSEIPVYGSFRQAAPAPKRNMIVNVRFRNPQNATSGSQFYISVNISYVGKIFRAIPKDSADYPEVFRSVAKPLSNFIDYEFELDEKYIRKDRLDTTFLRVLVLKQKPDGKAAKKAEDWVALKDLKTAPIKVTEFKQSKGFSSKNIEVVITGAYPQ